MASGLEPDDDSDLEARIRDERRRLREEHEQLSRRLHTLHAASVRLQSTADRVHRAVRRCEDTLHTGEELIAGRPRRDQARLTGWAESPPSAGWPPGAPVRRRAGRCTAPGTGCGGPAG